MSPANSFALFLSVLELPEVRHQLGWCLVYRPNDYLYFLSVAKCFDAWRRIEWRVCLAEADARAYSFAER